MALTDFLLEYFVWIFSGSIAISAYKFLLKVVSDDLDRTQIFFWVSEDRWWESYKQLLGFVDSVANIFLGSKLVSWVSFFKALAVAWIYPYIFIALFYDYKEGLSGNFGITLLVWFAFFLTSLAMYAEKRQPENWSYPDPPATVFSWLATNSIKLFVVVLTTTTFAVWAINFGNVVLALNPWVGGAFIALGSAVFLLSTSAFGRGVTAIVFYISSVGIFVCIKYSAEFDIFLTIDNIEKGLKALARLSAEKALQVGGYLTVVVMLIPLANGFLDWVSWVVSRYLIRRLADDAEKHAWFGVICHILLDLVVAFVLLVAVAIALSASFSLLGHAETWRSFQFDPWGARALPTTLMIFSTLVPTIVHLTMAVLAIASRRLPGSSIALVMLEAKHPSVLQRHAPVVWLFAYVSLAVSFVLLVIIAFTLAVQRELDISLLSFLYQLTSANLPWDV